MMSPVQLSEFLHTIHGKGGKQQQQQQQNKNNRQTNKLKTLWEMRLTGAQWVHCTIYRHNLLASLVLRPSHYPVTSCSMEKWRRKADIVDYTNDYLDGQRSNDHFCVVLVIPLDSSKANRKDGMGEP